MPAPRDPDSVRPALYVLTGAFFGAAALLVWLAIDVTSPPSDAEIAAADAAPREGGRRLRLEPTEGDLADFGVRDPGSQHGSVREAWAEAYAEPETPRALDPLIEQLVDPQMSAFRRSFEGEVAYPFVPTARRGRLTSARGLDIPAGAQCDVRVLPVADSSFNCLVRVTCGDVVVYPNHAQTAGYVSCELEGTTPTRAVDAMPTTTDGDPSVALDLAHGRVSVGDRDHETSLYDVQIDLDPTPVRVMM